MIALKVFAVVALAHFAVGGKDLDNAKAVEECFVRAITNGAPELKLPSFSPLDVTETMSWSGNVLLAKVEATWSNIKIKGLPQAVLAGAVQLSDDSSSILTIEYDLYFSNLQLTADHLTRASVLFVNYDLTGDVNMEWDDVHIKGIWNSDKPSQNLTVGLNSLTAVVDVSDVKMDISGIQVLGDVFSSSCANLVENYINGLDIGKVLLQHINIDWYANQTRIDALNDWCTGANLTTF